MILFDGTHLISDNSIEELFEFASKAGLRQDWFQLGKNKFNPHFDVTSERIRNKVIENRALVVRPRRIVRELNENRVKLREELRLWLERLGRRGRRIPSWLKRRL